MLIAPSSSAPKGSAKSLHSILAIIVFGISIATLAFLLFSHPTFAEDSSSNIVETNFFGNLKDDGGGCGVYTVLNLVVDIFSIGIGVLGVIGIIVVGIQYLTAGGNEQQSTKSKRRMTEIVIGLVAYAILYAFMQWLLPGAKLNNQLTCETVSDEELAAIKEEERATKQRAYNTSSEEVPQGSSNTLPNSKTSSNSKTSTVNPKDLKLSSHIAKLYTPEKMAKQIKKGKIAPAPVCTDCTWSERIAQTAELLAWPLGTKESKYKYVDPGKKKLKKWSQLKGGKPTVGYQNARDAIKPKHGFNSQSDVGADCGMFVGTVVRYSGLDKDSMYNCPDANEYYRKSKYWRKVSKPKRGDVCVSNDCHTKIVLGPHTFAEANHRGKKYGHVDKNSGKACGSSYTIWRVKI